MERCANCERTIGKLETPHVHAERVVCAECATRLAGPTASPPATPAAPGPGPAVCPRCRRSGVYPVRGVVGGEVLVCLLLLLVFLLPGVLFYAVVDGSPYCPHCRARV